MVGLFLAVATKVWMSESKTEDTAGGVNALTHLHNLLQRAEQSTVLDAKQESELEAAIQAHDNCTDTMTIGEQGDLDTLITAARLKYCKHGRTQETAANTEGKRKRVTLNRFSPDTGKETNKRKKKKVPEAPEAQKNWVSGDSAMCLWNIAGTGWYSVTILAIMPGGGTFRVRSVKLHIDTIISHPHHLILAPTRKQGGKVTRLVEAWQLAPPFQGGERPNRQKKMRSGSKHQPSTADVHEATKTQIFRHKVGDTVEALLKDTWHRARVSKVNEDGGYAVMTQSVTWEVTDDLIRDVMMDLDDEQTIYSANHDRLVRVLQALAMKEKDRLRKLADTQLHCHVTCVAPVLYKYSQNYHKRMVRGGWDSFVEERKAMLQPCLQNEYIYVGEQAFFGVTMLGTFSSGNWGMPLRDELDETQIDILVKSFKEKNSFGRSCFVLDRSSMIEEVSRNLRMKRDGSYVDPE